MRLLLCLLFLHVAGSIFSQMPETPPPTWTKPPLRHLHDLQLFQIAIPRGGPVESRYEFAVQSHEAYASLKSLLAYLEEGVKSGETLYRQISSRQIELSKAALETRDLIHEFRKELTKLGADVGAIEKEVATFQVRFQTAVSEHLLKTRDGISDAPEWTVQIAMNWKAKGLLVGYPDDGHYRGPASRYVVTVVAHAVWANLIGLAKEAEENIRAVATAKQGAVKTRTALLADLPVLQAHYRLAHSDMSLLIGEFYAEFVKLGADPDQMLAMLDKANVQVVTLRIPEIGEAAHAFPDVPARHWSAKAANELRAAGILVGYPDGRFHGGQ